MTVGKYAVFIFGMELDFSKDRNIEIEEEFIQQIINLYSKTEKHEVLNEENVKTKCSQLKLPYINKAINGFFSKFRSFIERTVKNMGKKKNLINYFF